MLNFPQQLLSYNSKVKNDFEWAKQCIDWLLSYSYTNHTNEYKEMYSNYQLYNNQLDQADFEEACNPLGIDVGQRVDVVQPYNKTYNKIQVLLGEELARPFNYKVVLTNSDGIRSKLNYKNQLLREYVLNVLKGNQVEMTPQDIEKHFSYTYQEAREVTSNRILNYLDKKLSLKDLKNDAYKHALISAVEAVYISEYNNEPCVEVVNPMTFFYHKEADTKFIQDGLYAGTKTYMTVAEVLDRYKKYLSSDDIKKLDEYYGSNYTSYDPKYIASATDTTYRPHHKDGFILVEHITWRSQRKVGFLKYINKYGEEQLDIVSEDFRLPNYTKETITKEYGSKCTYYYYTDPVTDVTYRLEWSFIPEVWQGTRIDGNIYCMMGPTKFQFRTQDNPYDVKLPYFATIYNNTNSKPISLMARMKPFQYLYFIVMHKLKTLISRDAGPVLKLDTSMVDPTLGWEKTLYFIKEAGIEFFNSLQNAESAGASHRGIVTDAANISTTNQILNYIAILDSLDRQISDTAGVTRQREGQVGPTEAVANAQSAISMSSTLTEIYFNQHSMLWQHILTGLLDVAFTIWKGKKITKQFILDDLSVAVLDLSPEDLTNAECSIFVTNSMKEEEMFRSLKFLSDRLLQLNNARFSDVIKLYKANSSEELENLITQSEKEMQEFQTAQMQAQAKAAEDLQAKEQEFELLKLEMEQAHELTLAEIESFKFLKDQDVNNNKIPDQLEIEKFKTDTELKKRKLDLEEKKLEIMSKKRNTPSV